MPGLIADILLTILAPIFVLVGIGALLRWKLRIDVATLSKLNIYLFVPGFVFDNVAHSKLPVSRMASIFGITVLQVSTLGVLVWLAGRALRVSRKTLAAVALAVMFYNSGNYGIPLAQLAYADRDGGAVQTFAMMAQNLLTFTLGMAIAASAHSGGLAKGLLTLARLPIIPGLLLGIAAQWWIKTGHGLPIAVSRTSGYIAAGLVPVSLITLGAQLATNPRWPRWKVLAPVLFLRLIFGPVQMMILLFSLSKLRVAALNVWPWPAELLILTASVPTAVNTLLLTMELDGDTELAADCVFWTTVFSCVTITVWLVVLRTVPWFR
jgi:predicted permease